MTDLGRLLVDILVSVGTGLLILAIVVYEAWESYAGFTDSQRDSFFVYLFMSVVFYTTAFIKVESSSWIRYD